MAQVTAAMIKDLRERTGIGMTKCKEALDEANGDINLAIENLRKAGLAQAVKKEGRATNEGVISVAETPKAIAIVEVNAETDFVVKNDRFQDFLKAITQEVINTQPASLESFLSQKYSQDNTLTIDEFRATIIQAIGENIVIRRLLVLPKTDDKSVGVYSHLGGKIVTAVEITGSSKEEELAKGIAMHVAAAAPEYLAPENVPENIINTEKEIAREQVQGKPANIVDKIVEGKLNAYYDATCLTRQKYIRDDSVTITELVNNKAKQDGKNLKLTSFIRWAVGQ